MNAREIHLGYELGTGEPVAIPVNHLAITGQTQMSGKTTTLEALISRSGLRAVAFVTKRAEGAFRTGRKMPAYFRERADWRFVEAVVEATMRERMKRERSWIMRASKGARTLADVQRNVRAQLEKARGYAGDMYMLLDEYLKIVIPQVERLRYTDTLTLESGLNIMDLGGYSSELQSLVIRSVLEWVYERETGVIVVIPEAWEFLPQKRGSPVKLAAVEYVRKGAGAKNYLWLDSQDLAGVDAEVRKQIIVWILGVQREANEVKRTLAHIPGGAPKPTVAEVMELERGQFIACFGKAVRRVYVQPAWMTAEDAQGSATSGFLPVTVAELEMVDHRAGVSATDVMATVGIVDEEQDDEEDEMSAEERAGYEKQIAELRRQLKQAQDGDAASTRDAERLHGRVTELEREAASFKEAATAIAVLRKILHVPATAAAGNGAVDLDAMVTEVLRRMPAGGGAVYQVAPVEKLRKDYQQRETERILAGIAALPVLQRDMLAIAEMGTISQPAMVARLGKKWGGWFQRELTVLTEGGWVTSTKGHGISTQLRSKIATDLAHYGASEEEIEATYQAVMAVVAGVPVGA